MRWVVAALLLAGCAPPDPERCNGVDDDDDGVVDEDAVDMTTWYPDLDGDGAFGAYQTLVSCDRPPGYAAAWTDCDDVERAVHPDAAESCNGIDDDCDGETDEDAIDAPEWYADQDKDGFGDPLAPTRACSPTRGQIADATDCDDTRDSVHPGATEACNFSDDDCDGTVDPAPVCRLTDADALTRVEPVAGETLWSAVTGDFDGDGVGDVACSVGTPAQTGPPVRSVAIWSGTVLAGGGVLGVADATWVVAGDAHAGQNGYALDAIGDLDGDGRTDLLIRDYATDVAMILSGATLTGAGPVTMADADVTSDNLDYRIPVRGVPDVNGDGRDELVIGLPDLAGGEGAVGMFSGARVAAADTLPLASPDVRFIPDAFGVADRLGDTVDSAGDLDGDGVDDLWLGGRRNTSSYAAYLHLAGDLPASGDVDHDAAQLVLLTSDSGGTTGRRFLGADWDADGIADILVRISGSAPIRVFHSTRIPNRFELPIEDSDLQITTGTGVYDLDEGDFDGDGLRDIVFPTGALPGGYREGGGARIVLGSQLGPTRTPPLDLTALQWTMEGSYTYSMLGSRVVRALPDLDGDGRDEVLTDLHVPSGEGTILLVFSWP